MNYPKFKKRICIILKFGVCKVSGPACSRGAHEMQSAVPGCGIQIQEEGEELATELCLSVC